jgi:hypothetical protein
VTDVVKGEGVEAARKRWPDLTINYFPETDKVTVGRLKKTPGATVSARLQPANGQDVRLGVDTDGSAWLADKKVMDGLLKANPRTLSVYSSAYHEPPVAHPLAKRTIVNVTISGWHPLPETLRRLDWAEKARKNGWNVILREVVASPESFTNETAQTYNRVHEALMKSDFFIMQQPLHKGSAHSKKMWGMPGCCVGSKANPKTCDACEVAEGTGTGFQKYWGIEEEPKKSTEMLFPDVPDYVGNRK